MRTVEPRLPARVRKITHIPALVSGWGAALFWTPAYGDRSVSRTSPRQHARMQGGRRDLPERVALNLGSSERKRDIQEKKKTSFLSEER